MNANPTELSTLEDALTSAVSATRRTLTGSSADREGAFRELQLTTLAVLQALKSPLVQSPAVARTIRNRTRLMQNDLQSLGLLLKRRSIEIEACLGDMRSTGPSAGAYRLDASQRSASGSWMNVRSAP